MLVINGNEGGRQSSPAKLGVLRNEVEDIEVQLDQGVINGGSIPILWNPLPSLVVSKIARLTLDCEETLSNILS